MRLFKPFLMVLVIFYSTAFAQHLSLTRLAIDLRVDEETPHTSFAARYIKNWFSLSGPLRWSTHDQESDFSIRIHQVDSDTIELNMFSRWNQDLNDSRAYRVENVEQLARSLAQTLDSWSLMVWQNQGALSYPLACNEYDKNQSLYALKLLSVDTIFQSVLYQTSYPLMPPVWSTDGEQLAFCEVQENGTILWIYHLSSGKLRKISQGRFVSSPCFSQEGDYLYFVEITDNVFNLIQHHLSSSSEEILFTNKEFLFDLSRSTKKHHLMFSAKGEDEKIRIFDFDCHNRKKQPFLYIEEDCFSGVLAPDHDSIFLSALGDNYSILMRHSYQDHLNYYVSLEVHAQGLTVSPSPNLICFEYPHQEFQTGLMVKSLSQTKEYRALYNIEGSLYGPCWSPRPWNIDFLLQNSYKQDTSLIKIQRKI